ncbi:MAG TPA: TfoX/Sxy family protein [Solirubrobacter sp.]|nr:TfoX/Sxy family protein [Solirubrobacter sp.]
MAYDERLAERIRNVISARPGVVERKMFGGIGWMINGNMAVGVMRTDKLCVRIDPDDTEAFLRELHTSEFVRPGGKPMTGFLLVEPSELDDATFARWVDVGAQRALALPPK